MLGGTRFLGRALVDEAVRRGWEVTTFNRGVSAEDRVGVHAVHGDRSRRSDLARLSGFGPWDVVVDVAGVISAQVRDAAQVLQRVCDRYAFVSTVSVYRDWPAEPVDEQSPLHAGDPDAAPDSWTWGTGVYGPLKAGAETAVQREVGDGRWLIVRPGVILGRHEYSSRLTWWLQRIAAGGRVVAPGDPGRSIQPVDVRDVACFIWDQAAVAVSGVFNLAAPGVRDRFKDLVDACVDVTGSDAVPLWVDDRVLIDAGIKQWTQIPLWRTAAGTWRVDSAKALKHGFQCRPLLETVADTWEWMCGGGVPYADPRAAQHGLSADVESKLLGFGRRSDLSVGFDRLGLGGKRTKSKILNPGSDLSYFARALKLGSA